LNGLPRAHLLRVGKPVLRVVVSNLWLEIGA